MNSKQSGFLRKDIIVILIAGVALLGLFGFYAINGQPVPIWQAVLVGIVNLVAAGKLFLTAKRAREEARHRSPPAEKTPDFE